MWGIFALLDPDPDSEYGSGSGSTGPIEYGSNPDPDPDPKPWAGGVVASITAVTQQDPLQVVPVSCNIRSNLYYVMKKKRRQEAW